MLLCYEKVWLLDILVLRFFLVACSRLAQSRHMLSVYQQLAL